AAHPRPRLALPPCDSRRPCPERAWTRCGRRHAHSRRRCKRRSSRAATRSRSSCPLHRLVSARSRRGDDQYARGRLAVVADRARMLRIDTGKGPLLRRVILAVDDQRRAAAEHVEHLLLVALALVLLGNLLAGRYVDEV